MAQWIRRPPTERKIPGSIPGVEDLHFVMQIPFPFNIDTNCYAKPCEPKVSCKSTYFNENGVGS